MTAELLALGAVLIAGALIAAYTLRTGISPMPTLPSVRRTLLAALPELPAGSGAVVELGAGWGTLALPLAQRFPERHVLAVELSPLPWAICCLRAALAGTGNLTVRRADFLRKRLEADLTQAALVVCYLAPGIMERLRPKLEAGLPAGAWVVSSTFAVPGWHPAAVHHAPDWQRTPVYVYRRPDAADPCEGSASAPQP